MTPKLSCYFACQIGFEPLGDEERAERSGDGATILNACRREPERELFQRSRAARPAQRFPTHPARACFILALRRFREALRKLERVLSITPDDVDTLAVQGGQLRKPRATCRVLATHPRSAAPGLPAAPPRSWKHKSYQAILERRPHKSSLD